LLLREAAFDDAGLIDLAVDDRRGNDSVVEDDGQTPFDVCAVRSPNLRGSECTYVQAQDLKPNWLQVIGGSNPPCPNNAAHH